MKEISLKYFFLGAIFLFISPLLYPQNLTDANSVDIETVKAVAKNFCLNTEKKYAKATAEEINLTLAETKKSDAGVLYYIFDIDFTGNKTKEDGYIIMSANYKATPVLCYVPEGSYNAAEIALNLPYSEWLNNYADNIESSIKSKTKSTAYREAWGSYLTKGAFDSETMELNLTSRWTQDDFYNFYSPQTGGVHPESVTGNDKVLTGCVATAMSQIINYYKWPLAGTGSHSYSDVDNPNSNFSCLFPDPSYGNLSFYNHTDPYLYENMPDVPSGVSTEISKLMYNCAVSVDMDWSFCGSWTNTYYVEDALRNYFGYNSSIDYVDRSLYNDNEWKALIVDQIRQERPVQYRGGQNTDGTNGHSWVCMGYRTTASDILFLFNWGWGGANVYVSINDSFTYQFGQAAVINISPTEQPNLYFSSGSLSTSTINEGVPFNINFTLKNNGTRDAGSSRAGFYLSENGTLDKGDIRLNTTDVGPLAVNGESALTQTATLSDITSGTYYIIFEADTAHFVHEFAENDNTYSIQITAIGSPSFDFRSVTNGSWDSYSTWEYLDGSNWLPSTSYIPTKGSKTITIQSGHQITLPTSKTVDQMTIEAGGQLTVSSLATLTVNDGATDPDLAVNGTVINSGAITANGVLLFNAGSTYVHSRNGGAIPKATWNITSNCNITGITNNAPAFAPNTQPLGNFTWNCPSQSTNSIDLGGQLTSIAGNFNIISVGTYTGNAYSDPDLRLGSTSTGNLTVGGNFTQSSGLFFVAGPSAARTMTVNGNFNLAGGMFHISPGGTGTVTVNGNFSSAGLFCFAYFTASQATLNITGSCSITGGNFNMSNVSSSGTLNLYGDFSHTGGNIIETASGSGNIIFKGTGTQTFTSGGTVSNNINYTVNSGSYLQMAASGTEVSGDGAFSLSSGAKLGIRSDKGITSSGTNGNIRTSTRIFSTGAYFLYNGFSNQNTGNGLPLTVNGKIIIDNTGSAGNNIVTLSSPCTIGSGASVDIINGIFDTGTNITHTNGSTINRSGGDMSGTPSGIYNVNYTGNSMNASSELSGTGLNNINISLTPGQTLTLDQNRLPDGDISINSGVFDLGSFACDRSASGGTLTVGNDATLKIGGTNTMPDNYATHTFGTISTIEYNGTTQTISPETYGNLTTSGTGTKTIASGTAVTVNNNLVTNDNLTIESFALDINGSLIVKGTGTGKLTYNRRLQTYSTIPPYTNFDWHYFSSPITGNSESNATKVTGVWAWNEVIGDWYLANITSLASGVGYNLDQTSASDGFIAFKGTLPSFPLTVEVSSPYADDDFDGNDYGARAEARDTVTAWGGGGWNLLGNPFVSALNVNGVNGFLTVNTTEFDPNYKAVYIYDGSVGEHGTYSFIGTETGGSNASGEFAYNNIQVGQGFFVLAMCDASSFTFTKDMQIHSTGVPMTKSLKVEKQWPGLKLKAAYGNNESSTTVVYNSEMTTALDPGYDVGQLSAGDDVEIFTALVEDNGVNFIRQALPLTNLDNNVIPVGIVAKTGGEVTFSADIVPIEYYKFFLEDRTTGIITDLSSNTYTVSLPAKTYCTDRFFLHSTTNIRRIKDPHTEYTTLSDMRIWSSGEQIIIEGAVSSNAFAEVYDLQGRKIFGTKLTDAIHNIFTVPSATSNGVYLIKVVDGEKSVTRKVVLL